MSANLDDVAASLRRDLDHGMHLKESSLVRLGDELDMKTRETLEVISQETENREGDALNLQLSINELREKVSIFKVELGDVTHRLWNAIENHTHDIPIDNVVNGDPSSPSKQQGLQTLASAGPRPTQNIVISRQPSTTQHGVMPKNTVSGSRQSASGSTNSASIPITRSFLPVNPPTGMPPQYPNQYGASTAHGPSSLNGSTSALRSLSSVPTLTTQTIVAPMSLSKPSLSYVENRSPTQQNFGFSVHRSPRSQSASSSGIAPSLDASQRELNWPAAFTCTVPRKVPDTVATNPTGQQVQGRN